MILLACPWWLQIKNTVTKKIYAIEYILHVIVNKTVFDVKLNVSCLYNLELCDDYVFDLEKSNGSTKCVVYTVDPYGSLKENNTDFIFYQFL